MKKVYVFDPVGLDKMEPRSWHPKPGTLVRKTQPQGCPPNGTMGHCFIEGVDDGCFLGLVLENSLTPHEPTKLVDMPELTRPWWEHWEDGASREYEGLREDDERFAREMEAW